MPRRHPNPALVPLLVTVLGAAPLLGSTLASAAQTPPAGASSSAPAPERRAPLDPAPVDTAPVNSVPRADVNAPAAPMPLNLPDRATNEEVQGEYGIGIATLVVGALLLAALVVGIFYLIARRSWSASH